MSEQRTTKDQVCYEPCYCKRCRGVMPAPCKYRGRTWLQLLWRRIWCAIDGHGGVIPERRSVEGSHWFCKRCGATVKLL
jgi:hypothetical protein